MNSNNFTPIKKLYQNDSGSRWIEVDQYGKKEKLAIYFPETKETKYITIAFVDRNGMFSNISIKIGGIVHSVMLRYSVETRDCLGYREFMIDNDANRKLKYKGKFIANYPAQTV